MQEKTKRWCWWLGTRVGLGVESSGTALAVYNPKPPGRFGLHTRHSPSQCQNGVPWRQQMAHFMYKRGMITLVLLSYHGFWGHSSQHFASFMGQPSSKDQSHTKHITWNLSCHHHPGSTEFTHNFLQFSINIPSQQRQVSIS